MQACPSCFTNQGIQHPMLGLLPCEDCRERQDTLPSPHIVAEIIPERIKSERSERQDSIEQPHFKGELNKRWVDLWGKKAAREHGFSDKEIKNAKYVMDGVRGDNGAIRYYKQGT